MSETRLNPQEGPPPRQQNNRTIFYIILILLLIGINIYLYLKYYQKNTESNELTAQRNEDSTRLADLDLKYQEALVSIESYRGQNSKLDSIIAMKEKELSNYKANLDQLKKQKKISEAEYKKQVEGLQNVVDDLMAQIELLKEQNQILITRNDSLGQSLASQITTNTELQTTNQSLSQKVSIASLLKPTSISTNGVRGKSSGKEVETDNVKKIEKLKVCFNLPDNEVAESGPKTFLVRIVSPEGTTLAVQNNGSGTFQVVSTSEQLQYTTSTSVDYDQKAKEICTYWQQDTPYSKGEYTTEIYQDGYLIGSKKFDLK